MPEDSEAHRQVAASGEGGPASTNDPSSTPAVGTWDTLGKLVLPASIACYFLGFLVAVPHFARSGVQVEVISPQTFVAAGLLFLALTLAAGICGVALRWAFARKTGTRWKSILGGFSNFGLPVGLAVVLSGGWWGIVYVAYVGFFASILPAGMQFSLQRIHLFSTSWNAVRALVLGLTPIGFFALAVYPSVPIQFGGGRPTVVLSIATNDFSVAEHDKWVLVGCRTGSP